MFGDKKEVILLQDFLRYLDGKKIYIVGISGSEGAAIADFLIKHKLDRNVIASDFSTRREFKKSFIKFHNSLVRRKKERLFRAIYNSGIKIYYKNNYLMNIEKADIIFTSQGWIKHKSNYPKLANIYRKNKEKFLSMTKLYLEFAEARTIGVTGSNGKSTTARLVYDISKNSKGKTFFAGNDRLNVQVLDKLEQMKKSDLFVIEISDRQLIIKIKKSPHIVVVTNIVPNHLDDHGTFKKYIEVKKRILKHQTKDNFAVLNFDNDITKELSKSTKARTFYFSRKRKLNKGAFLERGKIMLKVGSKKEVVTTVDKIKIPGTHNLENILAAALASKLAGVSIFNIRSAIEKFKGLEQRLEYVATKKGRKFYYDRQGTTPDATIKAIESFKKNIILIIGGDDKAMDFKELARSIKNSVNSVIILPGTASGKIAKDLRAKNFKNYKKASNVKESLNIAMQKSKKGDTIILSPACVFAKLEFSGRKRLTYYDFVNNLKTVKKD